MTTSWDPGGRVAVVTGASSGIGEATVRRLARLGMQVVAVARRAERLRQLEELHPGVRGHVADVRDTAAVDELAGRVRDQLGACHALVNNAGVRGGQLRVRADLPTVLDVLDTNLLGSVRTMAAFAGLLEESAPARVVNVGSIAGKLGIGPAGYAASKFGLVGLSEATALDWSRRGVNVTQLNPGFVHTEGFPQEGLLEGPLGRLVAGPEQVARAVHEALVSGRPEATVPRWYRALAPTRHLLGPLYWAAARRVRRPGSPHA